MNFQMKYILWLILSLPAIGLMSGYFSGNILAGELLHPTGEFSARFMIIAMVATPILILCRRNSWSLKFPQWLVRHRRAFGVAAFGYALLHTIFYLIDIGTLSKIIAELKLTRHLDWLARFYYFYSAGIYLQR